MDTRTLNPLKRYPLASFFLLAYAISWTPLLLWLVTGKEVVQLGIGTCGPAISAVILIAVNEGKAGLRSLVSRLFLWRVGLRWYLIAFLAPIVLEILAIPTHQLLGDPTQANPIQNWIGVLIQQLPWMIPAFFILVLMAVGEELGWRGYALPGLQARCGPVWGSLILGLLWGFWHLPLFWIPGSIQYGLPVPGYVLATIGYTFIYTCLLNGTRGSVLLASLYHGASNLVLTVGNAIYPATIGNLYLSLPALAVLVILVVWVSGPGAFKSNQQLLPSL